MALADEVSAVIRWMMLHPTEYETARWLALNDTGPGIGGLGHIAADSTDNDRRRVALYLGGATLTQCECLAVLLLLPDGRLRTWPDILLHDCPGPLGHLDSTPRVVDNPRRVRVRA